MNGLGQKQVKEYYERVDDLQKDADGEIPDDRKDDLENIAQANLSLVESGSDDESDRGQFFDFFENLHQYSISPDLERKAERLDRFLDLMFFFRRYQDYKTRQAKQNVPVDTELKDLENKIVYNLRYFQWRGNLHDLQCLQEIITSADDAIKAAALVSQGQITKRSISDLASFFLLDPANLTKSIDEMIENRAIGGFGALPEIFVPTNVNRALLQLNTLRIKIDRNIEPDRVTYWLNKPKKALLKKTPIQAIELGKTFLVLQILLRLEEGFH